MYGRVNFRGLAGEFLFLLTVVVTAVPAVLFGWKGFVLGVILHTSISLGAYAIEYLELRNAEPASERVNFLIESYAHQLGVQPPSVRLRPNDEMMTKGAIGYVFPKITGGNVVVLAASVDSRINSLIASEESKREQKTILAHEVAHTTQTPQVSLLDKLTSGGSFIVGAVLSLVVSSLWMVWGVVILAEVIRLSIMLYLYRWAEYDADAKASELTSVEDVLRRYDYEGDETKLDWAPFSTSPTKSRRARRLVEKKGEEH